MDTLTRAHRDAVPTGADQVPDPDPVRDPVRDPVLVQAPRQVDRITGVRLPDGRVVDVDICGRTVAAVSPAGTAEVELGPAVIDGRGYLALTAPAEPHAHLDKALSWGATRSPGGDLGAAIDAWRAFAVAVDEDEIFGRALIAARRLVANGTTAVRSHVDLHTAGDHTPGDYTSDTSGDPLRGVRALARVREVLADVLDLQIVVMVRDEDPAEVARAAIAAGADLIGGAPHIAPDPVAETHRLIDLAEELGIGIDLHVDEFLDGDHGMLEVFTERVAGWPAGRGRTAGHCCRIGALTASGQAAAAAALSSGGVGVVTLPVTNLYLQGRDQSTSMSRGLPPVRTLLDGGVTVAAGADNVRDPFNPVGRSDAVETAMLLVVAAHLDLDTAWHLVTDGAREVMGLPPAGPVPGRRADLLLVQASGLDDVIADAPAARIVLHAGRVVSARELVVVVDPCAAVPDPDPAPAPVTVPTTVSTSEETP